MTRRARVLAAAFGLLLLGVGLPVAWATGHRQSFGAQLRSDGNTLTIYEELNIVTYGVAADARTLQGRYGIALADGAVATVRLLGRVGYCVSLTERSPTGAVRTTPLGGNPLTHGCPARARPAGILHGQGYSRPVTLVGR
jgi:hypothetical protein